MPTTTQRATAATSAPSSEPRLTLAPVRASQAVLDGGWWPHSWDPVAELPWLVRALSNRCGPIRHLMLNSGAWDSRVRRLAVDADVVRVGWFATLDPALLIATTDRGDQLDVLVVPPSTAAATATRAMATAADPTNTRRAPEILAAMSAATPPAVVLPEPEPKPVPAG
jgi:Family of unknown function (DUF5994)